MDDSKNFAPSRLRVNNLLEQHFDTAFAAPNGISKLRELILTLAMQGKLVEQDVNDPPASELLREIEKEREKGAREGATTRRAGGFGSREDAKTRRGGENKLPEIKAEDVPYELPKGWEWVRLGEIGEINPRNVANDSGLAGFVPMPLIPAGYSENHQFEQRPWSDIKKAYTHFADGDVGMAKITPCFENAKSCVFSGLPNGIGAGTTELHIFRNSFRSVVPRFLLYYLKNPHYISKAVASMTGSAGQKRVPTSYFSEEPFPLPPLPEQQRIVARIDQLMARCDELEKLRKEREQKRLAVHAAAIRQLLDPSLRAFAPSREPNSSNTPTPASSREPNPSSRDPFHFLAQHFGELYTVKENVAELRKAILQLAVMGRLVEQDENDPPASELLREIEREKRERAREGAKARRGGENKLSEIRAEDVPYELPKGWEWVRLNDALDVRDGTHDTPKYVDVGYPLVTSKNIYTGKLNLEDVKYISEEEHEKIAERSKVDKGDILFAMIGSIGNPVIVDSDVEFSIKNVALFKYFMDGKPNNRYLQYYLVHAQKNMKAISSGAVQSFVSLGFLRNYPFPLPPLREQHRIVARIDQLMALCDKLDQQIGAARGKQNELLNAVMGAF
ncbi:MAG: restriction endonuclease subunit S [bacterium]|nr:restriction endonuclease subunit S [bacterium]